MDIKKVSIIGCGALGIMYASHMLKKLSHDQVQFIANQDRVDKYQNTEFYANGERQSFYFVSADACTGPSDLIIFTVKYGDLNEAIYQVKNHIAENTIILSFLNGISSETIIGETYNPAKIITSMVAGMDATRTGYAVNFANIGYVAFGALSYNDPQDIRRLASFFEHVQMNYEIQDDIMKSIWWKYILNIGVNQASALLKAPYGLFQTSEHAEKIMVMLIHEAYEVSCKLNVGIEPEEIDNILEIIKTLSPHGKTSMCQDIEAKRPTEIDMFAGTLIEIGKQHNVVLPVNTFVFNAIKALESMFLIDYVIE